MRIFEIILENIDHIKTYWGLYGIGIDAMFAKYNKLKALPISLEKNALLMELYSFVHELLSNPQWQNLENDPDFGSVYDSLLDLMEDINSQIGK